MAAQKTLCMCEETQMSNLKHAVDVNLLKQIELRTRTHHILSYYAYDLELRKVEETF